MPDTSPPAPGSPPTPSKWRTVWAVLNGIGIAAVVITLAPKTPIVREHLAVSLIVIWVTVAAADWITGGRTRAISFLVTGALLAIGILAKLM